MKKLTMHFNREKQEVAIEVDGKVYVTKGVALFCGGDVNHSMFWGDYRKMAASFWAASADPKLGEFFQWLKQHRNQISADEALNKFGADVCECTGDAGCICKKQKIYH